MENAVVFTVNFEHGFTHLLRKSSDWFLYDSCLRHERVKAISRTICVQVSVHKKSFPLRIFSLNVAKSTGNEKLHFQCNI